MPQIQEWVPRKREGKALGVTPKEKTAPPMKAKWKPVTQEPLEESVQKYFELLAKSSPPTLKSALEVK